MLVNKWMDKKVVPIDENNSIQEAMMVLKENRVKILPVIKKGKLTGILTDQGQLMWMASEDVINEFSRTLSSLSNIKVKDIMIKNPVTVMPEFSVEEAAEVLLTNDIFGTAVVNQEGGIEGMITQADLLKVLISLTGGEIEGVQFAFMLKDLPGSIKEITDIMRAYGGRIASILSSKDNEPYRMLRNVYIRVYNIDSYKLNSLKTALSKKAVILYMIDYHENYREIYSNEQI